MDPNWLKDQRKIYDEEINKLAKLLKPPIENGLEHIQGEIEKKVAELKAKEQELREKIETESNLEKKAIHYYQLMATINLLYGNNVILEIIKDKENLSTEDLSKKLNAKVLFLSFQAHHLHEKIQGLLDESLNTYLHQAISEINPTINKEQVEELHEAHHSMSELKSTTFSTEYQDFATSIRELYKNEYNIYRDLAQLCQNLINAFDDYKTHLAQKKDWHPELSKLETGKDQSGYNFAKKRQIFGDPNFDKDKQKYELKQRSGLQLLDHEELMLEERKKQLGNYIASGKVDKSKLASMDSEVILINQALHKINETRKIVMPHHITTGYTTHKENTGIVPRK